jgi:hypothetical protein
MALRMVASNRAADGRWFARKGIPEDVRKEYGRLSLSTPLKDVRHRLRVPPASSCRWDTARIQRLSNLPQRARTGLLCLTDERQDIRSAAVSLGLHGLNGALASYSELGVADLETNTKARYKAAVACAKYRCLISGLEEQ